MSRVINKRTGIVGAVAVVLIIGAIVVSTTFSSAMTLDEAKEIAQKYVPASAEFVTSEDEDNKFEVMFHDERSKERYEVEVVKETKEVKSVESQLDSDSGSREVRLTEQEAEKIVKERFEGVNHAQAKLSKDNGLYEYEVVFKGNGFYGDADVHPVNGKILESKIKFGTAVMIPTEDGSKNPSENGMITEDAAREAAIKASGGGFIKDIELDRKDGKYYYEVEVVKDNREYEYKVDASTGKAVLENDHESYFDYDDDDRDDFDDNDRQNVEKSGNTASKIISEEKAKNIVLAKVQGASIRYIELESDDGISVYDGKAIEGEYEYEFEIDASSGVIIEWDKERIDHDDEWDD